MGSGGWRWVVNGVINVGGGVYETVGFRGPPSRTAFGVSNEENPREPCGRGGAMRGREE